MSISLLKFLDQTGALDHDDLKELVDDETLCQQLIDNDYFNEQSVKLLIKNFEKQEKINLDELNLDPEVLIILPERIARKYSCVLFSIKDMVASIGIANPGDPEVLSDISDSIEMPVKAYMADKNGIQRIINLTYRAKSKIDKLKKLSLEFYDFNVEKINLLEKALKEDNPAVNLFNTVMSDAKSVDASDIHFEYDDKVFRIRIRVDGVMEEHILDKARELAQPLFRLIKLKSDIDISVDNVPQDGRLDMMIGKVPLAARVSVVPNLGGASCVIRLFADASKIPKLNLIMKNKKSYDTVIEFVGKTQGMALVTGPTGSGKTTTLYSILTYVNKSYRKIITIEDPVELDLPRINQIEVKAGGSFTFADALKACLRQDPDIVLVGEIRDENTANIALRAAITGHLVLSTLHTNSTIASISRLRNLGVSPQLMADAIEVVISQRLIKTICGNCKYEIDIKKEITDHDFLDYYKKNPDIKLYSGRGCNMCNQSGYRGRLGIYEVLSLDDELKQLMEIDDFINFKEKASEQLKGRFLADIIFSHVLSGESTIDEYFKYR